MASVSSVEELYRRHSRDVYRFAYWLCGDPSLAEDLTSETFVRAWTAGDEIRVETVKAYLLTIARNLFLQQRRGRKEHDPLPPEMSDPTPGPAARAEGREELRAVLQRVQQLPEVDRAALLMRALLELPYQEIARALGISPASARVKVHRARHRLAAVPNPQEVVR